MKKDLGSSLRKSDLNNVIETQEKIAKEMGLADETFERYRKDDCGLSIDRNET